MQLFSYNETKNKQVELRHIFLPGPAGLVSETIAGLLALVLFNISELSDRLLTRNFNGADPLPLWGNIIQDLLNTAQDHNIVQGILLFALWAVVGALVYILGFRILQGLFGAKTTVSEGVRYTKRYRGWGLFYWLLSLHDLFMKILIILTGIAAVVLGASAGFGAASRELRNGLADSFPGNLWPLLLSFIGAVLSVRLIVFGVCLLSRRFRDWYAAY